MSSTYSTNLAIELIGTGDQAGSWGASTNTNLGTLIEQAISGYVTQAITDGADTVITIPNGASGVARNMIIECTGTLTAARNLIVPANKKLYFIYNNTSGGFAVTVKVSGQTGVSVPNGAKVILASNGTDIVSITNYQAALTLGTALPVSSGGTGATTFTSGALLKGAGAGAVVVASAADIVGQIGATAVANATNATTASNATNFGGQLPSYYQTALGFTPVQQGGGAGQGTNKVYIGWGGGSQLLLQIDSTNFGSTWPLTASTASALTTAGGSAASYAARAWVYFSAIGATGIGGSGNVSSVAYNGVGDYTVNFSTAMQDTGYATLRNATYYANQEGYAFGLIDKQSSYVRIKSKTPGVSQADDTEVSVVIVR
jgi:hypothetical protein